MNIERIKCYVDRRIKELGNEILKNVDNGIGQPEFSILAGKREELVILFDILNTELLFSVGDKVRIRDAMDASYIGKIGIIEAISAYSPYLCKLNIDGKQGSWGYSWLFSTIEKI